MKTFEVIALVGAIAGLCMVIGGIWLIAKGAITLSATPADALTAEWRNEFRLTTRVPGLAFFIIGLLFVFTSLYFSRPSDLRPFEFVGEIPSVDQPVNIVVRPASIWSTVGSSDGRIKGKVIPDLSFLLVTINVAGYSPVEKLVQVSANPVQNIGKVELVRKVSVSEIKKSDVVAATFEVPDPSNRSMSGSFGVPK